ncbi:hypothetical protein EXN22_16135 [Pseudomonas tructae]|uniref:Uncharacterized protein n=1 Tax=Pseudomonas tructae TaxID=2518644 RepID=A0A411MK26_9PSED|nr:SGNH/GDSL hydrolase family protein [Pseudomonas tructae]QBF27145.1 hypothetical protein EXN22_16135 [Pseudomonas tructae]
MTVETIDSEVVYVTGGPVFPIPFRFLSSTDIQAVLTKVDGSTETLTASQFTITGTGDQSGGALTSTYAASALSSPGASLTIARAMSPVQPTDLRNQGKYLAETQETALDRLTMLIQQGFSTFTRALVRLFGKDYYDAKGYRIANVADPTEAQDAATYKSVGDLISQIQGPINNSSNVLYQFPDGSPHVVQDLSASTGANGIGYEDSDVGTTLDNIRSGLGVPIRGSATSQFFGGRGFSKVLELGDSLSAGNGQPDGFYGGTMGRTSRSVMNHFDRGVGKQRGFGYATLMNPYQELVESANGWSGSIPAGFVSYPDGSGGACGTLAHMQAGDWVEFTGREVTTVNFGFDATLSAGATWRVSVDGEQAATGTAGASGRTGDINLAAGGDYIRTDSVVRFTVLSGDIYYQHGQTIRLGNTWGPLIWCAPEGSQGFSDFATAARVAAIAPHINAYPGPTLVFNALATNNMIATVGKQLTPAAFIAALDAELSTWDAALTNGENFFVQTVPPRPNLVLPLATYEEYVSVLVAYAATRPRMLLVRTDLTVLGTTDAAIYYSPDNLHMNTAGHAIWAHTICAALGIPVDAYFPVGALAIGSTYGRGQKPAVVASLWSGAAIAERLFDGSGRFTAALTKAAGSGPAAFCQVRANAAPSANRPVFGLDQAGALVPCVIGTDRNVVIQGSTAFVNAITSLNIDWRYTL